MTRNAVLFVLSLPCYAVYGFLAGMGAALVVLGYFALEMRQVLLSLRRQGTTEKTDR